MVNIVKGLYNNIIMNSTAQMVDNNFEKSGPDENENIVKGFSNIYMESKKRRMAETTRYKSYGFRCSRYQSSNHGVK